MRVTFEVNAERVMLNLFGDSVWEIRILESLKVLGYNLQTISTAFDYTKSSYHPDEGLLMSFTAQPEKKP